MKYREFEANERLKKHIEETCRSKSAVAEKAGIRRDTFSRIVNNKRPIYVEEIMPLCEAAGMTLEELLGIESGGDARNGA